MGDSTNSGIAELKLTFDRSVYDVEAVKRAAYELMSRLRADIDLTDDRITCTLTSADNSADFDASVRDFEREILDQDLRLSLEARTEPLRSAILGLAFSRTGLQDG